MANPNKTVANARKAMGGFPARPPRPHGPFMDWFFEQVQRHGRKFESMEKAEAEYEEQRAKGGE